MTTISNDSSNGSGASELPKVGQRVSTNHASVEVFAKAELPTRFGDFQILVFRSNIDDKEHVALVHGTVKNVDNVPVRVHSECLTGDVLGSLRCDCRDQLECALRDLGQSQCGALLYMRQEGRGIGLGNKVRAYALQETGLDTFEANAHLGFDADLRDYRITALMLDLLGVRSINLATNNPHKITGLRENGILVGERMPLVTERNPHNAFYLASKARSGHHLPI